MTTRAAIPAVAACLLVVASPPGAAPCLAADVVFTGQELLGRPTDTSVTVHAMADRDLEAYFEHGTSPGAYTAQTAAATFPAGTPIEVVLGGLAPDTRYFYRMRHRVAGEVEFAARAEHTFRTRPSRGREFVFDVQADSHLDENTDTALYRQTLANVAADDPDFLVDLGDTFMSEKLGYGPAPSASYEEVVSRHVLARGYFDQVCHSVPLLLVIGNHEGDLGWKLDGTPDNVNVWATTARKLWYPNPVPDGFSTGNTADEPFVGLREDYYAFEWGDALVVVLDPYPYTMTKPRPGGDNWAWTLGRAQYDWFRQTLETSRARFKFVFAHHLTGGTSNEGRGGIAAAGLYEWGGNDVDGTWGFDARRPGWGKPIHQVMVENGVKVFFHGHDHLFAKEDKDGIVYQEVPQPGNVGGSTQSAAEYGYVDGVILGSSGHVRVRVSPSRVKVDYVRAYLPGDGVNGEVAYSYTILGDADGDGTPDDADPCTKVAPGQATSRLRLTLGRLDRTPGSQGLVAAGRFSPATTSPAIDPSASGVHVRVEDGAGEVYDVSIPGGLVGTLPSGRRDGWRVRTSRGRTRWTYTNRSGALPDGAGGYVAGAAKGIRRIVVRDVTAASGISEAAYAFRVTARRATLSSVPQIPVSRLAFWLALGGRDGAGTASLQAVLGQATEAVIAGAPVPGGPARPYVRARVSVASGAPRAVLWVGE